MNRKRYIKNLLLLNVPILSITLIYVILFFTVFDGGEISFCFMKEHLKLYCPGCGGSRSLIALLNFDIKTSFLLFPPLLAAVIIILELDFRMLLCAIKNTDSFMKNYSARRFYILAVLLIFNFLIRNVLLVFFNIDFIGDIRQI